ncbi:hypothetical protein [Nannocystis pusilla]|uniref:Uncharacterized protein n=1 Tax=Nannocystis pusilla TaxID=889268 RepID=A0ABS7TLH6_9BACT|nr:hypothetical protein [Nannocystis pusilla]MBZ5709060.1 hypothetical protein [Nannocystis pusilla]
MKRWWVDLWAFAAALALAAAVLLRWRGGQVALLSSTAAPAIRLLALLVVFVQGCADRLRGREEPAGQGAAPRPAGQDEGQEMAETTGLSQHGEKDLSDATGPSEQGDEDSAMGTGSPPAPALGPDVFPLADEAALNRWARLVTDDASLPARAKQLALALLLVPEGAPAQDPGWSQVTASLDALTEAQVFRARWQAHVEARRTGGKETIADALALLAAMEALPLYHAGLAGYLWRRAAPLPASATERAELLGRLERHLRACEALRRAQFETGPIEFTAWRSKAAPPAGYSGLRVPPGLLAAARSHYPNSDAGTWATQATLDLAVATPGVHLLRAGQAKPLQPGQRVTLRRLDVLWAERPATLRHDELGDMSLGAGAVVTAWDVGARFAAAGRELVRERVAAARGGDATALKGLEAILPAAHAEIRRAVAEQAQAAGSPGLRTLLELFDM